MASDPKTFLAASVLNDGNIVRFYLSETVDDIVY